MKGIASRRLTEGQLDHQWQHGSGVAGPLRAELLLQPSELRHMLCIAMLRNLELYYMDLAQECYLKDAEERLIIVKPW